MQPICLSLPEFEPQGEQAVSTPIRGAGDVFVGKFMSETCDS